MCDSVEGEVDGGRCVSVRVSVCLCAGATIEMHKIVTHMHACTRDRARSERKRNLRVRQPSALISKCTPAGSRCNAYRIFDLELWPRRVGRERERAKIYRVYDSIFISFQFDWYV